MAEVNEQQSHSRPVPQATRPDMAMYGISAEPEGMLSWDWVDTQLEQSRNYWISSTRPDGRPHATPVWGIWIDGMLVFGGHPQGRRSRNLAANPAVSIHLESGDEVVILEGRVEESEDMALLTRVAAAYAAKYPPFTPEPSDPNAIWYVLKPQVVFAWLEVDYPKTATRWRFE